MRIDYERNAQVTWLGDLEGSGILTTQSEALGEQPVSFYARLNHPKRKHQTTPEELLAAAHATDFAMVMAVAMSEAGHTPQRTVVDAVCAMERLEEGGYKLFSMVLKVLVRADGLDQGELDLLAGKANEMCPLSLALRGNIEISVTATLDQEGN